MTQQTETIDRPQIIVYTTPPTPDTLTPFYTTLDEPDPSLPFGFLYATTYGHHQRQLWQAAFDEAARRWLYSGRRRSDKTRRLYTEAISLWRTYLAESHAIYHLWQATDRHAAAWLAHLSANGNAPRTVAVRAAAVSSLYLYAKSTRTLHAGREISLFIDAHGSSRDNPFSSALVSRPIIDQYSDSERIPKEAFQSIIAYLDTLKPTRSTLRNKALLLTFAYTGWRADEVLTMTWDRLAENTDHPGQYTYRWTGKARDGQYETRPLPAPAVAATIAYLHADGRHAPGQPNHIQPGDYIWRPTTTACTANFTNVAALDANRHITQSTLNDILHRLLLRYFTGVARSLGHAPAAAAIIAKQHANKYSIHSLRHMFAWSLFHAKGKDIRFVAAKLGHKNIATTMKYLKSLDKPEDDYSAELAAQLGLGL